MKPKSKEEASQTAGKKTREYMAKYGSCAQSTVLALQDTFEMRDDNIFKAVGALTGGIGGMQDACASLLGSSMMFGVVMGRGIDEYANKEKLGPSMTAAAQLYKWFEKEFGSPTCHDMRTKYGGGVYYDTNIPWQAELSKQAGVFEKCVEMAGKTASRAAEMIWNAQHKDNTKQ